MLSLLKEIFTWWHNQTIGTRLFTFLYGQFIGQDALGNRYYIERSTKKNKKYIKKRRWVIYKGLVEPSRIPPLWHAWLHYIMNEPPSKEEAEHFYPWQKEHWPNLTGTALAYHPPGSLFSQRSLIDHPSFKKTSFKTWTPPSNHKKSNQKDYEPK